MQAAWGPNILKKGPKTVSRGSNTVTLLGPNTVRVFLRQPKAVRNLCKGFLNRHKGSRNSRRGVVKLSRGFRNRYGEVFNRHVTKDFEIVKGGFCNRHTGWG